MTNKLNSKSSGLDIVLLLAKYWKMLLLVSFLAAIISFGVSSLIRPKFKSTLIMFPTSSNAVSQLIFADGNYNEFLDASQFGEDVQIEQMIQILNSREIKDHLIEKFNLAVHYDIDTNKKYWKTKLYKQIKGNMRFGRTSNLAVEVSVEDEDPIFAAEIANEIAQYYDVLKRSIIQQRTQEAFKILEDEMAKTDENIQLLTDSLSKIMSHGIYDYESQSERLTQQYALEVAKGNTSAVNKLKEELAILETWAPKYLSIRDRLMYLEEKSQFLYQEKYQSARIDAEYTLPQKFVVEKAVPSDKKSYPKRLIIMIVSTLCVFVLAFFLLIIKDHLSLMGKEIKKQLQEEEN